MKKSRLLLAACAAVCVLAGGVLAKENRAVPQLEKGRMRAALLDLAKQPETSEFIMQWMERVHSFGINTVVLYLKGRASTSQFKMAKGDVYSLETMRKWVERGDELGITVIPAVTLLGHAEQFFIDGSLDSLSEEGSGSFPEKNAVRRTFCLSNPETRAFLERHVAELCKVFTGPYFHIGFDEAWNMGRCARCAPIAAKDGGDELFAGFVDWAASVCRRNGKRAMLWDDFFGYHRGAIEKLPRDVVMAHWNYATKISTLGTPFNFYGCERIDWLGIYAKQGNAAISTCWYEPENIRTLANYDRRTGSSGFLVAQWEELMTNHHGGSLPRILARVLMDEQPSKFQLHDAFLVAVKRIFPSLSHIEAMAVTEILQSCPPRRLPKSLEGVSGIRRGAEATADALALEILKSSALKPFSGEVPDDPLCERALLDDIVLRAETGIVHEYIMRCASLLLDPKRTQSDVDESVALMKDVRDRLVRIRERRRIQSAKWRAGLQDMTVSNIDKAIVWIDAFLKSKPGVAGADELRLEVGLTLSDFYGRPSWTINGLFSDGWRVLAKGGWKPGIGDWANYSRSFIFKSAEMPSQIKVAYNGCGEASLRYIVVEGRDAVSRPVRVVSSKGQVKWPERLLVDDTLPAVFGDIDGAGAFLHPERRVTSEVVLEMSTAPYRLKPL